MTTPSTRRGPVLESPDGIRSRPTRRVIVVPTPAAGTDWKVTVPGRCRWEIRSLVYGLFTSVTVANRFVSLSVTDGTTQVLNIPSVTAQVASQNLVYSAAALGVAYAQTGGINQALSIPDRYVLDPGWTIGSGTTGLQGTDGFFGISIDVLEHPTESLYGREANAVHDTINRARTGQLLGDDIASHLGV